MSRVFANGQGNRGRFIPKTQKWYLILPCLTLSIIRYASKVKWSNTRKGVALSPTPWCSSLWKGNYRVTHDYGRQFGLLFTSFLTLPWRCLTKIWNVNIGTLLRISKYIVGFIYIFLSLSLSLSIYIYIYIYIYHHHQVVQIARSSMTKNHGNILVAAFFLPKDATLRGEVGWLLSILLSQMWSGILSKKKTLQQVRKEKFCLRT